MKMKSYEFIKGDDIMKKKVMRIISALLHLYFRVKFPFYSYTPHCVACEA